MASKPFLPCSALPEPPTAGSQISCPAVLSLGERAWSWPLLPQLPLLPGVPTSRPCLSLLQQLGCSVQGKFKPESSVLSYTQTLAVIKKKKKSRCMGPGPGALPAKPAEAQPGTGRGWGASGRPRKTGLSGLTGCERGLPAWHSWRLQMVAGRDEEPLRLPVDSSCCSYEAQLSSGGMAVSEWCRWGYGPSPMSPTIKAPSPTDGGLTTGRADAPGQRRHRI